MKRSLKWFFTSFFITCVFFAVFVLLVITDYRCRKTATGDDTLPFIVEQTSEKVTLSVFTFGIENDYDITFIANCVEGIANFLDFAN